MSDDEGYAAPTAPTAQDELAKLRAQVAALQQLNCHLNKQIEDVDNATGEFYDDEHGDMARCVRTIRSVLARPKPEHIGPPESLHVHFHWRDRQSRGLAGTWEALPGDGFGFVNYVDGFGLRTQFDCAGIIGVALREIQGSRNER